MTNLLLDSVFSKIFNSIVTYIGSISNDNILDYIMYGSVGLLVLTLLITWIRTSFTYEARLLNKTKKLNKYLSRKQNIDENNLVEFNDKMKQIPKVVRHNWQEYMLNRDRPSKYINCDNCIDIPTRISAYATSIAISRIFVYIITSLTFILGLGTFYDITGRSAYAVFFQTLLIPILLLVLGLLFIAFLKARHTAIMADLYYNFQQFEKNLDRACKTMPEVIDYEILFTKKEIKNNIPVLQEYLEKFAALEKKRKEEEELLQLAAENYDFEELGVDSSLLLERAMRESEKYLNVKRTFSDRIRAKEQEKTTFQKNFDEVTKDFERKAQASREIINNVSDQINQTTSKIEANYLKKKLNDEQARYQQLEKDYDLASSRFQKEQQEIQQEIDKYNEEIKRRKNIAQDSILAEGKTYVNKIYGQVTSTVLRQNQPILDETQSKIDGLNEDINKLNETVSNKNQEIVEKEKEILNANNLLNLKLSELEAVKNLKEYVTSEEFKQRLVMSKKQLKQAKFEDRDSFKNIKTEMKKPVNERNTFDSNVKNENIENFENVKVVKLEDNQPSFEQNDGGVKVVKLEEPQVTVVKLEEEQPKPKLEPKTTKHNRSFEELEEINKSIEEENAKLEEKQDELKLMKTESKIQEEKKSLNDLKSRMSKLNEKSKKTTSTPSFNVPKIKK